MPITRAGFADLGGLAGGAPTSLTASFNNSGNILFVYIDDNANNPTSVTFNGVALTLLYTTLGSGGGSHLYYLKSPTITTANIVISYSVSNLFMSAAAVFYSGVNLSAFDGTSQTIDPTSETTYTTTVSTTVDSCWGVGFARTISDVIDTVSGSFPWGINAATYFNCAICDTNGFVHPAGSLTFTSTSSAATMAEHLFVSLLTAVNPVFSDAGARGDASLAVRSGNERRRIVWS